MSQIVEVSDGEIEYTWPSYLEEANGVDISEMAIEMQLNPRAAPGAEPLPEGDWFTPVDHETWSDGQPLASNQRAVKTLIDSSVPLGTYRIQIRINSTPERPYEDGGEVIVR